ncbi:Cdc7p-Dbf4p kinase complex regulatory subunit, partial [Teratosphaeriaceae sp. CCFEE 6253]
MASKRAPLANVPNAINSPFRNVAATNGKRTRAPGGDIGQGQPPAKRQVIEIPDDDEENVDPRARRAIPASTLKTLDEPFGKRSNAQPTPFERRLTAVRGKETKPAAQQAPATERARRTNTGDNLESIRQWQRHYKRQFPSFMIYFDGVPEDVRLTTRRQIQLLGAREEKFFSKAVTHVVTTRQIPTEPNTSPEEDIHQAAIHLHTTQPVAASHDQSRTANLLDAHLQRRTQTQTASAALDVDLRR